MIAPKVKCALFKGTDRAIFIDRHPLGGSVIDQIKESYKWVLSKLRSLPRGMTVEKMLQGESSCRNKVLAEALAYMFLIENWGSGMLRIKKILNENSLQPLEIVDFGSSVRAVIKRSSVSAEQIKTNNEQINPNKTQINPDKIVSALIAGMRENSSFSLHDLARYVNKPYGVVRGITNKLRKYGIIEHVGARKNGRWIVADWVTDEVLEIEDKELQPVRIGKDGKVEVFIDLDLSKQPELYAKLEIMAKREGKPIEEIARELIEKAVGG